MSNDGLAFPPAFRGVAGNLFALLGGHSSRPRLTAHTPQRHGGGVLAVIRHLVLDLAGGDSRDHDGALVGVGGALFAFRSSWHSFSLMLSGKLRKDWHMRVIVIALIYFATATNGFSQDQKLGTIAGAGATTCGEFGEYYRNNPTTTMASYLSWAQGFMSGQNIARSVLKRQTHNLGGLSISEQAAKLRAFCNQKPLAEFGTAVEALFDELPPLPQSN
jgi:hypothetical protein